MTHFGDLIVLGQDRGMRLSLRDAIWATLLSLTGNSLGNGRGMKNGKLVALTAFNRLHYAWIRQVTRRVSVLPLHLVFRSIFVMSRGKESDGGRNVFGFPCPRKNMWSENFRCIFGRRKCFIMKTRIVISYGGGHLSIQVAVTKLQVHKAMLLGFG